MSRKNVVVCDGCGDIIEDNKNHYELDKIKLKTAGKIWNGGHRPEHWIKEFD